MGKPNVQQAGASARKACVQAERSKSGFNSFLRPEENNTTSMNISVKHFTKQWNLLLDTFFGIFYISNPCVLLRNHRKFVGCEADLSHVTDSMPKLILIYSLQVLRKEAGINGGEHFCSSTKVHVSTVEAVEVRKRPG